MNLVFTQLREAKNYIRTNPPFFKWILLFNHQTDYSADPSRYFAQTILEQTNRRNSGQRIGNTLQRLHLLDNNRTDKRGNRRNKNTCTLRKGICRSFQKRDSFQEMHTNHHVLAVLLFFILS